MKTKKTITIFLLALLFIALGYLFSLVHFIKPTAGETTATISNEQTKGGAVLGDQQTQPDAANSYSSENFSSPQISFGGEAITLPSGQESVAPEITDLHSELLATKSTQQVKFLLSWKTNKPCESSITYTKGGQSEGKIIAESGYGFIHSAEISSLSYSTSYSYLVSAKDKWGTEVKSDKLSFYTGAPNVSIFDLLGGAFQDMFGWAGKK